MILLNKKRRTFLFWSCVFLFLVFFLFLSFSFFGVKVSFTEKAPKIEKTGAIYLEVEPDEKISFFLDKKLAHPKKRLFGGYFFEALLPGRYFLEIKKEGYFEWKKSIEVLPELVSFGKIKLIKKNLEENFVLKSNLPLMAVLEKEQKLIFKDKNQLKIFDLKEKKFEKKFLPKKLEIEKVFSFPFSSEKLLFLGKFSNQKENSIFEFDLLEGKIKRLRKIKEKFFEINPKKGEIFLVDKENNLVKENLFSKSKEIIPLDFLLTSSSTSSLELEKIKLKEDRFLIFVKKEGKFVFDLERKKLLNEKPLKADFILPDNEKLVFLNEGEIKIKYLKKIFSPVIRNKGKVDQLISFPSVKKIEFYKDHWHLFVLDGERLLFVELDPRKPVNFYPLSEKVKDFWYFEKEGFVLILKDNGSFFILKTDLT